MEIATTFRHLQKELSQARDSLKDVDENIKRFLGRDPNEPVPANKTGVKRPAESTKQEEPPRGRNNRNSITTSSSRRRIGPTDGSPPAKRRSAPGGVFNRLTGMVRRRDEKDSDEEDEKRSKKHSIQSQVIATPGIVVSRQEVVAAQNPDEKSKLRNRRMFGALLGTLQKFRQEETKLKDKEDKRAKVEMRLEEAARKEREKVRQEKTALFNERKLKQANLKKIEYKMHRMHELVEWEEKQRQLVNFIKTKAFPPVLFLPKLHNEASLKLLEETKDNIEKSIEAKRKEFEEELEQVERRGRAKQEREIAAAEEAFLSRDLIINQVWQDGDEEGSDDMESSPSKKEIKSKIINNKEKESEADEDSDLDKEAGPELDVDHMDISLKDTNNEEKEFIEEVNTIKMNVDEKEFEPVYD